MVELLAPAGDLQRLKVAIMYGADAVYFGSKLFSLRARASNFSLEDIKEAVNFAHSYGKKVYITVNMIPHNDDLEGLKEYLLYLDNIHIDAIIVASKAIMNVAKELNVSYQVHVSTQQTTINHLALNDYANYGVTRLVLGREVNYEQLKSIRENAKLEVEVFIHGGMCANYSGRCTISNLLTNRDANRGGCAHSCRWYYHLYHNNECLDNSNGLLTLGSKDMCAIEWVEKLCQIDVASFKIEGRMKTAYYIANIVKAYRIMIDAYYQDGFIKQEILNDAKLIIEKAANRETFEGFYAGNQLRNGQLYENDVLANQSFVANILSFDLENNEAIIEVRNHFEVNDQLEILRPIGDDIKFVVEKMYDLDGNEIVVANKPLQKLKVKLPCEVNEYCFIRKVEK